MFINNRTRLMFSLMWVSTIISSNYLFRRTYTYLYSHVLSISSFIFISYTQARFRLCAGRWQSWYRRLLGSIRYLYCSVHFTLKQQMRRLYKHIRQLSRNHSGFVLPWLISPFWGFNIVLCANGGPEKSKIKPHFSSTVLRVMDMHPRNFLETWHH